jgi:hypothetical protein
MVCPKCSAVRNAVKKRVIPGAGGYPSTKELAYMVDLEYYIQMNYACIHEVPEDEKAQIKVKDLIKFLDDKNWQLGTRTSNEGDNFSTTNK